MRRPGDRWSGLRDSLSLQGNDRAVRGRLRFWFKRQCWMLVRRPGDRWFGLRNSLSLQGNDRAVRGRLRLWFKRQCRMLVRRPGDHWLGLRNPLSLQGNERPVRGRLLTGCLPGSKITLGVTPCACFSPPWRWSPWRQPHAPRRSCRTRPSRSDPSARSTWRRSARQARASFAIGRANATITS